VTGGEVEQVGRAEPGQHHVGALAVHPGRERGGELRGGRSHVVGDDDGRYRRRAAQYPHEGRPEGAGDLGVELVRHGTPDVVGLDEAAQLEHRTDLLDSEGLPITRA